MDVVVLGGVCIPVVGRSGTQFHSFHLGVGGHCYLLFLLKTWGMGNGEWMDGFVVYFFLAEEEVGLIEHHMPQYPSYHHAVFCHDNSFSYFNPTPFTNFFWPNCAKSRADKFISCCCI